MIPKQIACSYANINATASSFVYLKCGGYKSCENITFYGAIDESNIDCSGDKSCRNSLIDVSQTNVSIVQCTSTAACQSNS